MLLIAKRRTKTFTGVGKLLRVFDCLLLGQSVDVHLQMSNDFIKECCVLLIGYLCLHHIKAVSFEQKGRLLILGRQHRWNQSNQFRRDMLQDLAMCSDDGRILLSKTLN